MARSYAILKDGIPYSNVFTSLKNPEKILNLWFERWKFSNNSNPPEGNYSVRVGIETALDFYGVKRKG